MNLVVIRSKDLVAAKDFYEILGLQFKYHQHGEGPQHIAAENDGFVFEIYPYVEGKSTEGVRIGFRVNSIDFILSHIPEKMIVSSKKESEWGTRAVVSDPDGHRVELIEGRKTMTDKEWAASPQFKMMRLLHNYPFSADQIFSQIHDVLEILLAQDVNLCVGDKFSLVERQLRITRMETEKLRSYIGEYVTRCENIMGKPSLEQIMEERKNEPVMNLLQIMP